MCNTISDSQNNVFQMPNPLANVKQTAPGGRTRIEIDRDKFEVG